MIFAPIFFVGIGMMTRGEVALIVSQKGLDAGSLDQKYFAAVILLIIVSPYFHTNPLEAALSGRTRGKQFDCKRCEIKMTLYKKTAFRISENRFFMLTFL